MTGTSLCARPWHLRFGNVLGKPVRPHLGPTELRRLDIEVNPSGPEDSAVVAYGRLFRHVALVQVVSERIEVAIERRAEPTPTT